MARRGELLALGGNVQSVQRDDLCFSRRGYDQRRLSEYMETSEGDASINWSAARWPTLPRWNQLNLKLCRQAKIRFKDLCILVRCILWQPAKTYGRTRRFASCPKTDGSRDRTMNFVAANLLRSMCPVENLHLYGGTCRAHALRVPVKTVEAGVNATGRAHPNNPSPRPAEWKPGPAAIRLVRGVQQR